MVHWTTLVHKTNITTRLSNCSYGWYIDANKSFKTLFKFYCYSYRSHIKWYKRITRTKHKIKYSSECVFVTELSISGLLISPHKPSKMKLHFKSSGHSLQGLPSCKRPVREYFRWVRSYRLCTCCLSNRMFASIPYA